MIFNEAFGVQEIWKIPREFVAENSTFSEHQNGHIFFVEPDVLAVNKGVMRIR